MGLHRLGNRCANVVQILNTADCCEICQRRTNADLAWVDAVIPDRTVRRTQPLLGLTTHTTEKNERLAGSDLDMRTRFPDLSWGLAQFHQARRNERLMTRRSDLGNKIRITLSNNFSNRKIKNRLLLSVIIGSFSFE
jgi:hypothetical protein